MSALAHIDALANHVTRFSGDSSAELSSLLLAASAVAMTASGIGLIILCVRALIRSRRPPTPAEPLILRALAAPTVHTRVPVNLGQPLPLPRIVDESAQHLGLPPISEPAPLTLRRPPVVPGPSPVPAFESAPSSLGPSSTDPTLEMDLGAFANAARSDNDVSPPDLEVSPPSEPTDTEVFVGGPIPLVSRREEPAPAFEIPPPPPPSNRSGTVPIADSFVRTLSSFNDGARRA